MKLSPGLCGHGIAEAIEPGAWVEVLPSRRGFSKNCAVGVPHDEESKRGVVHEELLGPLTLAGCGAIQLCFIYCVIAEHWTQQIHQPKAQIRVQQSVGSGGNRMLDQSMDELGSPAWLGQSVTMNRRDGAASDLERRAKRIEAQTQVLFPKIAVPPVMVPADHHDRHPAPEPGQCGGDVKAAPGDDPRVRKPEIEEIAVDQ